MNFYKACWDFGILCEWPTDLAGAKSLAARILASVALLRAENKSEKFEEIRLFPYGGYNGCFVTSPIPAVNKSLVAEAAARSIELPAIVNEDHNYIIPSYLSLAGNVVPESTGFRAFMTWLTMNGVKGLSEMRLVHMALIMMEIAKGNMPVDPPRYVVDLALALYDLDLTTNTAKVAAAAYLREGFGGCSRSNIVAMTADAYEEFRQITVLTVLRQRMTRGVLTVVFSNRIDYLYERLTEAYS